MYVSISLMQIHKIINEITKNTTLNNEENMTNLELEAYLNTLLDANNYKDYCPNGLQIEGKNDIQNITCGVTASQELIDLAITEKSDAIIVHHGYFFKNEASVIKGIKKQRIKKLLENNINLFAYHLPLDCHPTLGNNFQLAKLLNIKEAKPINSENLIWQGVINEISTVEFANIISEKLNRKPLLIDSNAKVKNISWCTGAAQNMIEEVINLGVDTFISGEVSEQTYHLAKEYNINYFAIGHHASERYGIKALSDYICKELALESKFTDLNNPI